MINDKKLFDKDMVTFIGRLLCYGKEEGKGPSLTFFAILRIIK